MMGVLEFPSCWWLFRVNQRRFRIGRSSLFQILITLIWRGSRKEFLPPLNTYRICSLYHQFAIYDRLSCFVNFWYLTFRSLLIRVRHVLFSPGTTSGTLIGSQAGLAKTCFPTVLCHYHLVLFLLLCLCLGNACCPQSSRSTGSRK